VENAYCTKQWGVPVIDLEHELRNDLFPFAKALGSAQSSIGPCDLSSDDEEWITLNNVAAMTTGRGDYAAHSLFAGSLYSISPPESPTNWGQVNPNLNDYHSEPMEISSIFWILDITDWWRQQAEMHSKYADLSNMVRIIFSIIPHGVTVEASVAFPRDVMGWRQLKPQARPFAKSHWKAVWLSQ